jgi:hypothetical protein
MMYLFLCDHKPSTLYFKCIFKETVLYFCSLSFSFSAQHSHSLRSNYIDYRHSLFSLPPSLCLHQAISRSACLCWWAVRELAFTQARTYTYINTHTQHDNVLVNSGSSLTNHSNDNNSLVRNLKIVILLRTKRSI